MKCAAMYLLCITMLCLNHFATRIIVVGLYSLIHVSSMVDVRLVLRCCVFLVIYKQ